MKPICLTSGLVCAFFIASAARVSEAHENEDLQKYKEDGTYEERAARAQALGTHEMSDARRQRAVYKLRRAALQASGLSETDAAQVLTFGPQMAFPFAAQPELQSEGVNKTLTILVDFKDIRASDVLPALTTEGIAQNIYGTGTQAAQAFFPHESLHNYYDRASRGLVDIQGSVLGWHHFSEDRETYQSAKAPATLPPAERRLVQAQLDQRALFRIFSDALDALDANHDFSQYDNDSDGDLDLVTVIYAGPNTGWGSFWWAYRWDFGLVPAASSKEFDGKTLNQFVFQFANTRGTDDADFNPTTLIHEMGHAFGLADYYDYDPEVGPDGGVGGLDMMHANQGNHCAFSRWLLDWIKPTVIGSGPPTLRHLRSNGSQANGDDAIAIFPGLSGATAPSQELFIVEYRPQTGNDKLLPGSGLLIWHVDASLKADESDFANNNSDTARKLLRLVRANNPVDFGENGKANAGTYYLPGKVFDRESSPSSKGYGGVTNIAIDRIANTPNPEEAASLHVGFQGSAGPALAATDAPSEAPAAAPPAAAEGTKPPGLSETVRELAASKPGDPIDLDLMESLDRKFARATSEELKELWQDSGQSQSAETIATSSSLASQMLLTHWAAKDGKAAVNALLDRPANDRFLATTYPLVMESWVRKAPLAAAEWYASTDNQARLQQKGSPEAGRGFARRAFAALYAERPDPAIEALDALRHSTEVLGAVEGLQEVSGQSVEGSVQLAEQLKQLENNADRVGAAQHVLEAEEVVEQAAAEIEDPDQRMDFEEMLESTLKDD